MALESQRRKNHVQEVDLAFTPTNRNREKDENYVDVGEKWIEVIRKSRGKHPRKKLQC
jgi:hypothetical protein